MPDTRFQKGNTFNSLRKIHAGGRPPRITTSMNQEIVEHPERVGVLLDQLYDLATHSPNPKIQLQASIDYLDRMGVRAPKESSVRIEGIVSVGTPEDYRRAALLLAADREAEAKLLGEVVEPIQVTERVDSTG